MNDLMTKSFLSYVELKRQAQMDLKAEAADIENGRCNRKEEDHLSLYFQEVDSVKSTMEEITNLLLDLHTLNEETKSTHSTKVLRGLWDRIDSDMVSVLRKAKFIKARLKDLEKSNVSNRGIVDRTRFLVASGLRAKLRDTMNDFQSLREKIMSDHKENLKRKYYNATGEVPTEEVIETMISGRGTFGIFEGKTGMNLETKERHEDVMDIQRSLNKLHQVFLDMAVLVENQSKEIDDIEHNVAVAGSFVGGGTDSLMYAKQMKKKTRTWICWVCFVVSIILLVCFISMLSS